MYKLSYITQNALQRCRVDEKEFHVMLQLVIWGYREYFMDYGKTVRIAELSIDNFSEAACPEDMVNWTSLYYQTEKGAKYTFVQDDSIALPNDD